MHDTLAPGFTVADIAARYRVGPDKVRAWIRSGELAAINTSASLCRRARFVVTAEALERFESRRTVTPPPKQKCRRRSKQEMVDYYPD
jgi:hypothetical protein